MATTTTTNVIVPENQSIYNALLAKAATYTPSQPWKAYAYKKAAESIATYNKNIFKDYELENTCYGIPYVGVSIEEFIYNFIDTTTKKAIAPLPVPVPVKPVIMQSSKDLIPEIQYVRLYQNDEYNDDSIVYLQWTGNEHAITSLKAMLKYIYKNTDRYDIDLGNEYYTLHININKKLTQNEVDTICKKGLGKCSGIFTFPQEFANIDYRILINKWDLGDIIMSFDTDNIYGHFRTK